jgi:large subunit ribosomal protein L24
MASLKIKKGDSVIVIAGADKGKTGQVLKVFPKTGKILISGVNVRTIHKKQTATDQGGKIKMEKPITISNVSVVDPKSGKATRVGFKVLEDGKKVRIAKKSGEVIG